MPNKTIKVADILEYVNHQLNRPDLDTKVRVSMGIMIDSILHKTGNYEGFSCSSTEGLAQESANHYYVSLNLGTDYKKYTEERKKNDGFR